MKLRRKKYILILIYPVFRVMKNFSHQFKVCIAFEILNGDQCDTYKEKHNIFVIRTLKINLKLLRKWCFLKTDYHGCKTERLPVFAEIYYPDVICFSASLLNVYECQKE